MRKIIQVQPVYKQHSGEVSIFAVCDDGTVWKALDRTIKSDGWTLLPNVPQEHVNKLIGK